MSEPYLISFADLPVTLTENLRGGQGIAHCRTLLSPNNLPPASAFCGMGINVLPPGSSIGLHLHPDNEEIYLVMSGTGMYIDTDGSQYPVKAGDAALCPKGGGHGIVNTGTEDMMVAGIAAQK